MGPANAPKCSAATAEYGCAAGSAAGCVVPDDGSSFESVSSGGARVIAPDLCKWSASERGRCRTGVGAAADGTDARLSLPGTVCSGSRTVTGASAGDARNAGTSGLAAASRLAPDWWLGQPDGRIAIYAWHAADTATTGGTSRAEFTISSVPAGSSRTASSGGSANCTGSRQSGNAGPTGPYSS